MFVKFLMNSQTEISHYPVAQRESNASQSLSNSLFLITSLLVLKASQTNKLVSTNNMKII